MWSRLRSLTAIPKPTRLPSLFSPPHQITHKRFFPPPQKKGNNDRTCPYCKKKFHQKIVAAHINLHRQGWLDNAGFKTEAWNGGADEYMRTLKMDPKQKALLYKTRETDRVFSKTSTKCLMLSHLFDPFNVKQDDFNVYMEKMQADLCENGLVHIFVDKNDTEGVIYLKFETREAAAQVKEQYEGTWIRGKKVSGRFVVPQHYDSKFNI